MKVLVGERVFPRPIHRIRQRTKKNSSSGGDSSKKGENCTTNPLKRFFACNPKARNHPQYAVWHEKFKKANKS